jgi:hypothetical protein
LQYVPRRWLLRSQPPYVDEESAIADMLDLAAPRSSTALNPAPLRRRRSIHGYGRSISPPTW